MGSKRAGSRKSRRTNVQEEQSPGPRSTCDTQRHIRRTVVIHPHYRHRRIWGRAVSHFRPRNLRLPLQGQHRQLGLDLQRRMKISQDLYNVAVRLVIAEQ
jgi:hypothetical protein